MGRPSRSDEHPPSHEEARIEAATRGYFDDLAPKRHTKPSRSDPDALLAVGVIPSADAPTPELTKFQDLEAHSQKIACESDGSKPTEEYMATEYYDDLNCVDKHHHTTGTGFIRIEGSNSNTNERYHEMAPGSDMNACIHHPASKGNPATNDWIPSAQTQNTVSLESTKPQRSDV